MGQLDNEVAALNKQWEFEELSRSPTGKVLSAAAKVVGTAADVAGLSLIGGVAKVIGVGEKICALGVPTVDKNFRLLGDATEDALSRVEMALVAQGTTVEEIQQRIASPQFEQNLAAAVLQTQRTTQESRLRRMAWLLANGVKENDLEPESLDDMLRAAVELTDRDILVLRTVAETQATTATFFPLTSSDGTINRPREVWQELERRGLITLKNQMEIRSSLERLRSMGFGAEIQTTDSIWLPRFLVTPVGEKFITRLREIVAES